jgi:nucleotide-binding universal stress UspA family protein
MSIFPTKILLATDGSTEAELAARTAVDLSQKTDSELHLIHVMDVAKVGLSMAVLYSEATDPEGVKLPDPVLEEELEQHAKQEGREVLEEEVQRVSSAGGTVAQLHLRLGEVEREIVHLAEDVGAGLIVMGSRGHRGMRRALMGSVSDSVLGMPTARLWWCVTKNATQELCTRVRGRRVLRTSPRNGVLRCSGTKIPRGNLPQGQD